MNVREANRERAVARWRRVHESEKHLINSRRNRFMIQKARLHAYLCGDGSVSVRRERASGKLHCEIRFYPDHISMLNVYSDAFWMVYGKRPHVKRLKNHFRVAITSITAAQDLLLDGPFSSTDWKVPGRVIHDECYSIEWLRAFFDAEAYVGRKRICLQCVNNDGLTQVETMLKRLGIDSRRYVYRRKQRNWNTNYHLVMASRSSKAAFLKMVGFNHKLKLNRLKADVA